MNENMGKLLNSSRHTDKRQTGNQTKNPAQKKDRTVVELERRVRVINDTVASLQRSQVLTKEVLQRKVSF